MMHLKILTLLVVVWSGIVFADISANNIDQNANSLPEPSAYEDIVNSTLDADGSSYVESDTSEEFGQLALSGVTAAEKDKKDDPSVDTPNSTIDSGSSSFVKGNTKEELEQITNDTTVNATISNVTQKFVQCVPGFAKKPYEVQLVNDTELIKLLMPLPNITTKDTPAPCVLVLFYSKYCPFSSMAAPHFNALPRAFPDIKMVAINAMMYHLFNTQNGIVGVPSVLLFHNGKPVAKYNQSDYSLELFSKFLTRHTGIEAEEKSHVTSADFSGPVTSVPSRESDMFLVISWGFIILCAVYYFTKSKWFSWIVETVQNNWRESAQHAHID